MMKQVFIVCSFLLLSWILYLQVPNKQAHFDIDSFGYQALAQNFYYTHQLTDPAMSERAPVQPVGYPFFMGCVYTVFGVHIAALIWVQIVLMALTILLLMRIAERLFGQIVMCITGILAACNIAFLVYPQFVLAETVLLFLVMFFWYCLLLFYQQHSVRALYCSAVILGLSTIIKPTALCFPIILVPLLMWYYWPQVRQGVWVTGFFVLIFCVPIVAYMARNYYLYGYFSFAPMMPLNMYQCLLAKVISRVDGVRVQEVVDTQLRFAAANAFDSAGWESARTLFYDYLWRYPHVFVYVWLQNVLKTLFGLFSTQLKVLIEPAVRGGDCSFFAMPGGVIARMHGYIMSGITHDWLRIVAYTEAVWSVVRWLLAMIGLASLWHEKKYGLVCIFVVCIVLFSFVTGMDGCCRYRITFEPLLLLLTAYALERLYTYKKKRP